MTDAGAANPGNSLIAVAVSGGADSLYALLRLREQGHSLLALHGLFLPEATEDARAREARAGLDATCKQLGVPLHIVDARAAFARLVIEPFVRAYARGQTPNPCALCNARVKFGLLLDQALRLGAGRLATGHYAGLALRNGEPALLQGKDQSKDQSYFLALVPARALGRALFPLERTLKSEVLAALDKQGLTPPLPGESQEVCFIPGDAYRAFLPRKARELGIPLPGPGRMLLTDGTPLGTHQGLWRYTEGQRKGLGVSWREPLYVLGKEWDANILRLGVKSDMGADGCRCGPCNILLAAKAWPETVLVKTRYREAPVPARAHVQPSAPEGEDMEAAGPILRIAFARKDQPVAAGQIAALYIPDAGAGQDAGQAPLRLAAGGVIL